MVEADVHSPAFAVTAGLAGQTLQQLGYQNVTFIVDGCTAWSALGLPVVGQPL